MYKILAKTLFIGKVVDFVSSCHSTNAIALEKVRINDIMDGTIFITNDQYEGKGQRGNSWESSPGKNLTFSLVLKSGFLLANEQFYLNIITSLALYNSLYKLGIEGPVVKWPNDILVNRKKICGILLHNTIKNRMLEWTVIGIGLNVNQNQFQTENATSIANELSKTIPLQQVLEETMGCFEPLWLRLKNGEREALLNEYYEVLYLFETPHLFKRLDTNTIVKGTIKGINEVGQLRLALAEGREENFDIKQIAFIQ